jgi:hypothetical protein
MNKKIKAWYFAPPDKKLRYGDNRKIVVGRTHKVKFPFTDADGLVWEKPSCCHAGLHASIAPCDALEYARSSLVYRVELSGAMDVASDKIAATERTYLWGYDAEPVLRRFARMCAIDVIHLWDAPDVVVHYLKTGDESIRDAAMDAARAAAWGAAWDAASVAARAARAARDAAWDAARAAAWAAARADARAVAREAAWAAARTDAREKQNRRLYRMLMEGRAANV